MISAIKNIVLSNWKLSLTIGVLVGGFFYYGHLQGRISDLEDEKVRAQLRADSLEAAQDTTRELMVTWRDSARYFERRAVQAEIEKDSVDEELQQESRARAELSARIDSLNRVVDSDSVIEINDIRYSTFDFYNEPYQVHAEVTSPPPPHAASMDMRIRLDPVPIRLRIGCSEEVEGEIRKASIGVETPEWAQVNVVEATQTPAICNPEFAQPDSGWFDENRGKLGIALGAASAIAIGLAF